MRTCIVGGTIVTAADTYQADILIENGKIIAIGQDVTKDATKIIDATGKLVMPGGIDPHTHLDMETNVTVTSDDFATGTIAAVAGGTTTIIDFANQEPGESLHDVLRRWHQKARGKSVIDYSFHIVVRDLTEFVYDELLSLPDEGITSIKLFLAYKDTLQVDDQTLFKVLERSKETGSLVAVHCENGDVIDSLIKAVLARGKNGPLYHALTRPTEVEREATGRAIALAHIADVPIYIVHVSCKDALEEIIHARKRGIPVYGETCIQYLSLDDSVYEKPDFEGAKYVCSPPLRPKEHQAHLWNGLKNGYLHTLASDHCPFCFDGQKDIGKENFALIPNGIPTIEDRLKVFYTLGVNTGEISLNQFVDITSTRVAKIFGLYPKKGTIAIGSDADIVIWDPNKEEEITARDQFQHVDYNSFEGMKVKGVPDIVIARGETVFQNNEFVGVLGRGEFVPRNIVSKFQG